MKIKIKIITITILTLIAVGLISALFIIQYNTPNEVEETSESIFTKNIIDPDRIVYKNENGQYYQFLKGTDSYKQIKETIENALQNYNESGNTFTQEEIDKIHEKSFIE